jgi:hypothetical protein
LETALFAGLAAIVGLIVGHLWDARSEAIRWRRDQRIRAYEHVGHTYYKIREAFRVVALSNHGTAELNEAISRALDLGGEFNRAVFTVWLHGSEPVARTVGELSAKVNDLFLSVRSGQLSWEEWRVARGPAEAALERFAEAIRSELSLPHIPVAIRISYPDTSAQESSEVEP